MEYQYYIVYKITNLLNDKYYIGVHSTNDLNDGYLGSGRQIKEAIKKYGKEHFKKDILHIFTTLEHSAEIASELMFKKEAELVNENVLKDPLCYNITLGGDVNPNMKDTTWAIKGDEIRKIRKDQITDFKNKGYEIGRYHTKDGRWVNREGQSKMVKKELFAQYINEGWSPGRAYPITANTVWITKNNKCKMVKKQDLQKYLQEGYTLGRNLKKKIKVHDGIKTIMIDKSELNKYLKKGYKQGLHYKTVSGLKEWIKDKKGNLRSVYKDGITKRVLKEQLKEYLQNGWQRGYHYQAKNRFTVTK